MAEKQRVRCVSVCVVVCSPATTLTELARERAAKMCKTKNTEEE